MKNVLHARVRLVLLLAAGLAFNPAFAEKPSRGEHGGGHSRHEKHDRHDDRDRGGRDEHAFRDSDERDFRQERYFNDQHRTVIREYYVDQYRSGRCPPGLAKRHNGCVPPGRARRWVLGRPLPRDVIYYDVPAGMVGYPPPGYRFVRVASDILMIAVGTGMVMDAITDLNAQ
jgi:Ni/Co efflux regulator RcnB